VLAAAPASAHPAPGMSGLAAGLVHPFAGLDHMLAMLSVGLLAGIKGGRLTWALPGLFVTCVVAGAVTGLGLPGFDLAEIAVALSVLVFGVAVILSNAVPVGVAVPLIAAFALVHGFAHGTEAPDEGALAFIAGMAASTLALHMLGVGAVRIAALRACVRPAGGLIALAGLIMVAGIL
jgi:urease accessory protein